LCAACRLKLFFEKNDLSAKSLKTMRSASGARNCATSPAIPVSKRWCCELFVIATPRIKAEGSLLQLISDSLQTSCLKSYFSDLKRQEIYFLASIFSFLVFLKLKCLHIYSVISLHGFFPWPIGLSTVITIKLLFVAA
jgi:hypothetical protein